MKNILRFGTRYSTESIKISRKYFVSMQLRNISFGSSAVEEKGRAK